jgi:CSLREA domain-containing protein
MPRFLPLLPALLLALAAPVHALEFVVTTTADGADPNPGDGVCDDGAGECTLRAAIQTANASPGEDLVTLPDGIFTLTLKRDAELPDDETGDLDVTSVIIVAGGGEAFACDGVDCTRIDGKGAKDRIFDVAPAATLFLRNLGMSNGKTAKNDFNPTQLDDEISGGCIRVSGTLDAGEVVVDGCSSVDDGGCIGVADGAQGILFDTLLTACKAKDGGAGIEVDGGVLDLQRVTISGSSAGDEGGGIEASDSVVDVQNVTLSGNKAKRGGGLIAESDAEVFVNNSTFAGNSAKQGASILGDANEPVLIGNSILVSKKGNDCDGFGDSNGGNIDAGTSCSLSGLGDQSGVDPQLGELADNGGLVPTHALLAGSPAIDRGIDVFCEDTDARGEDRVDVNGVGTTDTECDAGAYEFIP